MSNHQLVPAETILSKNHIQAAIFDLDGTILDNNSFHLKSWLLYLKERKISISKSDFDKNISGRTNKDALEYIFNKKMDDDEATKYTLEKEAIYRELYKPHFKEIAGFTKLLAFLERKKIKMAIATSGIQPNIDFMFENLPVKQFFREVVNSSHIKNGKPDPEIYLLTASKLDEEPAKCLVFEDSLPGILSAKTAGMKVVGITTTHKKEELTMADYVITDFNDLLKPDR